MKLGILYVGVSDGTCRHRADALRELGHAVDHVVSGAPRAFWAKQLDRVGRRLGVWLDLDGANRRIRTALAGRPYDLLWIDKGLWIEPGTLREARRHRPGLQIVAYSPDDMMHPANQSPNYLRGLPLYDLHVTTKSYNVAELGRLGARDVLFIDNAYEPAAHRPLELDDAERRRYETPVGFVGTFETDRANHMLRLAERGIQVTIWGSEWEKFHESHPNLRLRREALGGLDYARAVNGARINLAFLRKAARDLQTTRSVEIPACGAFMLAERTDEHLRLFAEGREAEFFSSFEELERKCRYYLEHEAERARVAAAGLERCRRGGYGNAERLRGVLAYLARRSPALGSGPG